MRRAAEERSVRFRMAGEDDGGALGMLRWQFFAEEHPDTPIEARAEFLRQFRDFFSDALRGGRWTVWVAERDGELVGNAWICSVPRVPRPQREPRPIGYLTNVYVVPEARNAGIGSQLLAAVAEWAPSAALEELIVWPSTASRDYYGRAGFVPSAEMMEREVLGYDE